MVHVLTDEAEQSVSCDNTLACPLFLVLYVQKCVICLQNCDSTELPEANLPNVWYRILQFQSPIVSFHDTQFGLDITLDLFDLYMKPPCNLIDAFF